MNLKTLIITNPDQNLSNTDLLHIDCPQLQLLICSNEYWQWLGKLFFKPWINESKIIKLNLNFNLNPELGLIGFNYRHSCWSLTITTGRRHNWPSTWDSIHSDILWKMLWGLTSSMLTRISLSSHMYFQHFVIDLQTELWVTLIVELSLSTLNWKMGARQTRFATFEWQSWTC